MKVIMQIYLEMLDDLERFSTDITLEGSSIRMSSGEVLLQAGKRQRLY
jgi:hypothetical protein